MTAEPRFARNFRLELVYAQASGAPRVDMTHDATRFALISMRCRNPGKCARSTAWFGSGHIRLMRTTALLTVQLRPGPFSSNRPPGCDGYGRVRSRLARLFVCQSLSDSDRFSPDAGTRSPGKGQVEYTRTRSPGKGLPLLLPTSPSFLFFFSKVTTVHLLYVFATILREGGACSKDRSHQQVA